MNLEKTALAVLIVAVNAAAVSSMALGAVSTEIHLSAAGSPYTLKKIDCAAAGASAMRVSGLVQLVYPGEELPGNLPTIEINCDNVIFDSGAKLTSLSSLVLNAHNVRGSLVVQTLSRSDGRSGNVTTRVQSGGDTGGARSSAGVGSNNNIQVESVTQGANGSNGASVHGADGSPGASTSTVIEIPGLSRSESSDH